MRGPDPPARRLHRRRDTRRGGRAQHGRRARRYGRAGRVRERAPRRPRGPQRAEPAHARGRRHDRRRAGARGHRGRGCGTAPRGPPGRGVIEARGLTRRFGGAVALDRVSFEAPDGAKVALFGANGAGKTTLLNILSTLLAPTEGDATVAGHGLREAAGDVRASIGVLTHRPMLYEELTPRENLEFFARLYGVEDAATRVEELLRRVGLWTRRDEQTAVLSHGFHQRLAIARAVLHRPAVLLLDEPETGLDRDGLALLDELVLRAPGVTVLAATHQRERAGGWAELVIELDRGRVVEPSTEPAGVGA
ncbi:MAG: ABC transporter ATP-binding protein [Chloroflexi bacterium]|nr:ABC transporter ATP-binding protein [Chloroflexota bacterium]